MSSGSGDPIDDGGETSSKFGQSTCTTLSRRNAVRSWRIRASLVRWRAVSSLLASNACTKYGGGVGCIKVSLRTSGRTRWSSGSLGSFHSDGSRTILRIRRQTFSSSWRIIMAIVRHIFTARFSSFAVRFFTLLNFFWRFHGLIFCPAWVHLDT